MYCTRLCNLIGINNLYFNTVLGHCTNTYLEELEHTSIYTDSDQTGLTGKEGIR